MEFQEFKNKYEKVTVEEVPNKVASEPTVSVFVQTYNHVDYIKDCLDGILMQETDFSYEILLGEDESKDGTRDICIEYAKKHPDKIRLFLHHRENNIKIAGRPTGRFNFLYNMYSSNGKYIAICEGDDYWTDPLKLQKQVEFLEANEDFSMVYQRWVEKDGDEIRIPENNFASTHTRLFRNIDFSDEYNKMENVLNGDTVHAFLLRHYGKFKCIEDLEPAVKRRDSGGIWNSLNEHKKSKAYYHTDESLYKAFKGTKYAQKAIDRYIKTCKRPNIKKELNISEIDTIKLFYNEGLLNEYVKISLMSFKKSIILFIRKYIPK